MYAIRSYYVGVAAGSEFGESREYSLKAESTPAGETGTEFDRDFRLVLVAEVVQVQIHRLHTQLCRGVKLAVAEIQFPAGNAQSCDCKLPRPRFSLGSLGRTVRSGIRGSVGQQSYNFV